MSVSQISPQREPPGSVVVRFILRPRARLGVVVGRSRGARFGILGFLRRGGRGLKQTTDLVNSVILMVFGHFPELPGPDFWSPRGV